MGEYFRQREWRGKTGALSYDAQQRLINRAKCMKKEMVNTLGSLSHEFIYNQTIICDIGVELWIIVYDMLRSLELNIW